MRPFTVTYDDLVEKYGVIAASIYGRIERFESMDSGQCYASQKTIAEKLNLSVGCVKKWTKILESGGHLKKTRQFGGTNIYKTIKPDSQILSGGETFYD